MQRCLNCGTCLTILSLNLNITHKTLPKDKGKKYTLGESPIY